MPEIVSIDRSGTNYWITVVPVPKADAVLISELSREGADSLITQLAMNPEMGELIPNSGGLRKVRVACKGHGKSGGLRVIYLYHDLNMPLFIVAAYKKTKQARYTEKELAAMRKMGKELVEFYAAKKRDEIGLASRRA